LLADACEHGAFDGGEGRRLHAHGLGRSDVASEDDVEVAQVCVFAGRERDRGVIQNLEEQVEDEWVRFLHFVEEQRAAVGAGEHTAEQPGVVGMRANQFLDGTLILILRQ
jgi:hypothetical protein